MRDVIPGLQVHPFLRILWIGIPLLVLLASIPLDLGPLIARGQEISAPTVAVTARPTRVASATSNGGVEKEVAMICGLQYISCGYEAGPSPVTHSTSVGVTVDASKMETLHNVCARYGLGDYCAKILYAMHLTETGGNCSLIGDHGKSYGCFQIQVKMHHVSKAVAMNLSESADWTLQNLIGHGLKNGLVSYAIRRHNGDGPMSFKYLSKVRYTIAMIK